MTKFSAPQQSQLSQIGAFLREQREKQGKSLEDIAIRTYIRPQLLNGIETGDPELLPEPIFVQGFIRRYAEALGFKGTELAQQFTVNSIPSTPRPSRPTEPEDSATTRLMRTSNQRKELSSAPAVSESAGEAGAMFNAGKAEPSSDRRRYSAQNRSDVLDERGSRDPDIPLMPEAAPEASTDAQANTAAEGTAASPSFADLSIADAGVDEPSPFVPDLTSTENSALTDSVFGPGALTADSDTNSVDLDEQFQLQLGENASVDTVGESADPPAFDDDLPAVFTTAAPSTATPPAAAPPVTSLTTRQPEPVGVELSSEGPNLKPFVIGGVVIAALTAGLVLLANTLGGDRTPEVVTNPTPTEQAVEGNDTEVLPELPEASEPEAPPVSDAPVFVEAIATGETWVSIIADGNTVFEGTLQPGDTQVWEAQSNLSVYSGDPGALQLAANGGESSVMGQSGQPEEKVFSPQ